ncbi:MAG: quinol:cytochrome C oxidoreductase [Flavobacteriales bacterium]|nr:quinol:cytochrome C oxidoreductase [Flavobacteriales bacterium]MCX7650751.1 quinol:cytochrome C oxidoreductase [Flavobacteriales bacterium]MDW8433049.1 quinol:cytochrome C oxidoreductase [Flavobacteriales bacterium]
MESPTSNNFSFPARLKTLSFILMGLGLAGLVASFLLYRDNSQRVWSNLLISAFFFTGISLAGTFFLAVNIVGESGWYTVLRRIPEALGKFMPFGLVALAVVVITGVLGLHKTWIWMDKEIAATDELIQHKSAYLNVPFFLIRFVLYAVIWYGFTLIFRKQSLQDELLGTLDHYYKMRKYAATFLVLFAVTSSTSAWDFLMSIDVHWFSTLFGWYIFAGYWVSGIAVMLIILLYLKSLGYFPQVNQSHIHDLAKFLFAFSIFWTYLYFSQFMLYFYANIPEEIIYFMERYDTEYRPLLLVMVGLNFVLPLLVLMTRDSKRNAQISVTIATLVILGHYIDLYQIVMPGTNGTNFGLGLPEISCFALFAGLFVFSVFKGLEEVALVPAKATFLDESLHHTT